ncbi:alpha/beta-hydrolase [Exidia glandulosa HHB12029]|uniref:Alpha/beta-hydrolase n=1 Tax=Exidia glandulosa HHB12029 TaxID=1314781 RepID=A0A165FU37_EXIGL|nr:alpha/beta-hydrolase [Exidia glandulosa HHB12029]
MTYLQGRETVCAGVPAPLIARVFTTCCYEQDAKTADEPGYHLAVRKPAYSHHWRSLELGSSGYLIRAFAIEQRLSSAAPLARANSIPAALLDALAGYRYLVHNLGFEPKNIIVEGDSAGAHLGVNLVMYLNRLRLTRPGGLLMLSPALDWARTYDKDDTSSLRRNLPSDYINSVFTLDWAADAFRGSIAKAELASNAYLSPASLTSERDGGLFSNFPPTCIIAGEAEVTVDAMRNFRDRLLEENDADVVAYHEHKDAFHNWLFMSDVEPYKSAALGQIRDWVVSMAVPSSSD